MDSGTASQGFPYDLAPTWDAVTLYRKLLAEQPDQSVVLISVGYLTNLKDLLESPPDKYSKLAGTELIIRKVKFLSCMGGTYPEIGIEANFQDLLGYSKVVVDSFPRPILFTSKKVGQMQTGTSLLDTPKSNPVRAIYKYRQKQIHPDQIEHSSFDLLAVLVAIRDASKYFDLTESGTTVITLDDSKKATSLWHSSPDSGHTYFTHKNKDSLIAELNKLLGSAPANQE